LVIACAVDPGIASSQALSFLQRPAGAPNCTTAAQPPTSNDEVIECFSPRASTDVWTITRPNVKSETTSYPNITFRAGDLVHVIAGGCVQSGGSGLTWKRYVNPMDRVKGSDDMYFGTILIPGGFQKGKIQDAMKSSPIPVVNDPGSDRSLRLGYADDGYGDNGYWGHDWGWWEQCRESVDAFVVIVIQHNCAVSSSGDCIRLAAMDMSAASLDPNGFLEDPKWGWQQLVGTRAPAWQVCGLNAKSGGMPEDDLGLCTRQLVQKDTYWACARDKTWGRIEGHANWPTTPVTYHGMLTWDDHGGGDDDYTLNLSRDDEALFTEDHWLQIEFDSDETIDHFHSPWWTKFHSLVDQEDAQKSSLGPVVHFAGDAFGGKAEAIVIGLMGLDCVHACDPEIHPVWAMAIRVSPSRNDDMWAFFVRNWGDEGFCGRGDHKLDQPRSVTFRLPFPNANGVTLLESETMIESNVPLAPIVVTPDPDGGGAFVTMQLPDPSAHALVSGDLHLKWSTQIPVALLTQRIDPHSTYSAAVQAAEKLVTSGAQAEPEEEANLKWRSLTKQQRITVKAGTKSTIAPNVFPLRAVLAPPKRPHPPAPISVKHVDDAATAAKKEERDRLLEQTHILTNH
jgi:hypothetical protein